MIDFCFVSSQNLVSYNTSKRCRVYQIRIKQACTRCKAALESSYIRGLDLAYNSPYVSEDKSTLTMRFAVQLASYQGTCGIVGMDRISEESSNMN